MRSGLDTPIRVLYHSHSTSRESGVTVTVAHKRTRIALLSALGALAALLLLVATACGGSDEAGASGGDGGGGGTLSLVAYSTPREAYEEIIPAFKETDA